jgi:DHA1 family bicyclomycin/chloramphenicol resistance-like MFS transporter
MSNKSLFPLLIVMVIFSPLAIDIFLPALPIMATDLGGSMSQVQWSISAFILSMGFGQLASGPLADRYGRKPVAMVGIVIYGFAAVATSVASTIEWHLIARLVQGFGACAIAVAAFSCVRDRYDAIQSGVMYSYLNGAICCIPALAPILGDVLTVHFGWRSNFEFIAAYAVVGGVIVALFLKETRPANTVQHKSLISFKSYWPILKHPVFLFNSILVMLAMGIIIAYVSSSPAWLMVELGLSQSAFVFWFSINAAINIAACFLAPQVLKRYGARTTTGVAMLSLIGAGIAVIAMLSWSSPMAYMAPVMMSSLGFSLLMGTCSGQALAPFGEKAGTASALLGFMQMAGAAVIVFLVQLLPINAAEQLGLLMLSVIPVYLLWLLPSVKKCIALDGA